VPVTDVNLHSRWIAKGGGDEVVIRVYVNLLPPELGYHCIKSRNLLLILASIHVL
jgi:hypothetical protein